MLQVNRLSLSLSVWTLIPVKPYPLHPLNNLFNGFFCRAFPVSILNPQYKLPAIVSGKEIVEKSSPHTADMQIPSWTWGKSYSNLIHKFYPFQRNPIYSFILPERVYGISLERIKFMN